MESPSSLRSRHPRPGPDDPASSSGVPFALRRRQRRQAAGQRAAARAATTPSPAQREQDPLARGRASRGGRLWSALGALLGSSGVHAAVVGLGFLIAGIKSARLEPDQRQVEIQVRQHEPPPPPPPPPPEPPPPEAVKKPTRPPPVARPEPPPEKPPEPTNTPPPRVVGLSLESTTEGGGGPAFAVGNTRAGETAERAVAPADVPREAPPPEVATPNQAARRIPTAGVVYTQPRRKQASPPPYPETLKAQGIEGDVPVMVRLDASGRVEEVKIIKESVYPEFNEAARTYAAGGEYEPATRDGVPIPFTINFVVHFRLQDE